jgi:tetratricopeptide (TPR) repeat protein
MFYGTYHGAARVLLLCLCLAGFSCGDFKWSDLLKSSSLRRYDSSTRIEKINEELALLGKKKADKAVLERMGDLHEQLMTLYLEKEDMEKALVHLRSAFNSGRNNPYLNYAAGLIYGNRGVKSGSRDDIDLAEQHYRRAVEMKSSYDEAWYGLAILLFYYKNERAEPIKILENVSSWKPSNYRARFALGRMQYESGRPEEALGVYEKLRGDLEKLPDSPIVEDYRQNCEKNIARIKEELSGG